MASPVRIEYEPLVASYWDNLTTQLRGFKPAEEHAFLSTWVHEEDDADSILNIAECAKDAGIAALTIRLGKATLVKLDLERLTRCASELGTVHAQPEGDGMDFDVVFDAGEQAELAIHELYRPRLRALLKQRHHEGPLDAVEGQTLIECSVGGATLRALVDGGNHHLVKQAKYEGASEPVVRGLLECLCGWAIGRPIQEVADHGALAVEYALREPGKLHRVEGVIQPENADPAFALPGSLARGLLAAYRKAAGYAEVENFFDPPPSPGWRAKSGDQRLTELRAVLHAQPGGSDLEILRMEGSKRVIVRFVREQTGGAQRDSLLKLERAFKERLEPELQIYLEPMLDRNVLRKDKL
ncbi:MAG: hypothetical protein M5U26_02455 [Planctomycetota bacterium]|nr:hypothetical protein [Planctomycetota bacterium]